MEEPPFPGRNKEMCIEDKMNLCFALAENNIDLCMDISIGEEKGECIRKLNIFSAFKKQDIALCDNLSFKTKLICKALIDGEKWCKEFSEYEDEKECIDVYIGKDCSFIIKDEDDRGEDKQQDCRDILALEKAIINNNPDFCDEIIANKNQNLCKAFITQDKDFCDYVSERCESYTY